MEFLPIVFEHTGERTGDVLPRQEVILRSEWCQTTNIYVLNSTGELLCHRRSLQKERLPGVWMTHLGGHVGQTETYETNAVKELAEESGISVPKDELIHWRTTKIPAARVWVREFVTVQDISLESLVPQPGEVEQFAWLGINDILQQYREHPSEWCAGTHNLYVEYHCLRAVITAAQTMGNIRPSKPMHAWHPLPS